MRRTVMAIALGCVVGLSVTGCDQISEHIGWFSKTETAAPATPSPTVVTSRIRPSATPAPPPNPALATARATLARLPIEKRAQIKGYTRSKFGPQWDDNVDVAGGHNGCNTRDDILKRDLVGVGMRSNGCFVDHGVLHDPYTGRPINFVRGPETSGTIQIDHVVALADAWMKGAQAWTPQRRAQFANDPINLVAVESQANQDKSARDAASWLPPNAAYHCTYVIRQLEVKSAYQLWLGRTEYDAMKRVLAGCT